MEKYSFIARERGEVIVRRWNDEVKLLKTHIDNLELRLAEMQEALKESHQVVVYVQNNTEHLKGCPNVPMTCMRCVVDDLRKKNEALGVENV